MARAKAKAHYNPVEGIKESAAVAKRDLQHKPPKIDTTAQEEALEQARIERAQLDEEENRRRKRLFSAAAGARAFRGSPMFRARPSNTAGRASSSASTASAIDSRVASIRAAKGLEV